MEEEVGQEKTSEASTAEVRRDQEKKVPSLPYPRDMRQVGGKPLSLCNLGLFACGPSCTPCKDEISLPLCVGSCWVGVCCC